MSDATPSNNGNGKKSGIWHFLFGRRTVEPIVSAPMDATPASAGPGTPVEELRSQAVDDQIETLQRNDQVVHQGVMEDVKKTLKRVRCAQLRVKRMNGGLTQDEEAELAQEC